MIDSNNLSVIVFSKDRPLQLQGYIESLMHFSKITPNKIAVLYKDSLEISYEKLIKDFQEINWIKEDLFFEDLLDIIQKSNGYIMFGCDDVIFKDFIDFDYALKVLKKNKNVFGFSLRLGKNIKPFPKQKISYDQHIEWNWKNTGLDSWNYPWELDSTIYRKNDIKRILSQLSAKKIINPNFFESEVAFNPNNYVDRDSLASFISSKSIVLTVNRVQENFKNEFDNLLATDIKSLNTLYKNGGKLDFIAISKKNNKKIHVGAEYFKIKGSDNYNVSVVQYVKKNLRKFNNLLKNKN